MNKQFSFLISRYSLIIFLAFLLTPVFVSANSWTKQTGSGAYLWWAVSGSSDATKLIALPDAGYVYTSTDSGEHWSENQILGSQYWMDAVSSSDGSKMVIASDSGPIYYSSNSGSTWNTSSANSLEWGALAASSDGSIVYATAGFWSNDVIYKSTDYGATFAPLTSGSLQWRDITTSADGQIVVAVVKDGAIYYSGDSGATWNLSNSGNKSWRAVTSSSNGQYVAAVVSLGGAIYTSSDYGATWSITSSGDKDWKAIASSANGSKLVAVEFSGMIYSSLDSGVNWGVEAGAGTGDWRDIFSSSDGEKLVALNYTDPEPGSGGYIFTYGPALISVTTPVVITVGTTQSTSTAQLTGDITSDGNASSTDRGFHYGLTTSYGLTSSSTGTFGIGSYSKNISGLNCGTLYHYRAFAINSAGTGTSTDSTFTTDACPSISTPSSSGGAGGTSLLTRAISFLNKSGIHSSGNKITLSDNSEITDFLNKYTFTDVQNRQIKSLWKDLYAHGYGISISTFKDTLSKLAINPQNTVVEQATGDRISAIFTSGLYKGLESPDVMRLQKLLAKDRTIYPEAMLTGFYGNFTEKAVQRFQIKYGVVSSAGEIGYGYVGPKTRAKLLEIFSK